MSIFFRDPNEVRLPPDEVRLKEVHAVPSPDGRRVRIMLELTPFQKRPNVEVTITSPAGKEVAHTSILETMQPKLEFNMHMRDAEPGMEYRLETRVYYQETPKPSETPVEIPLPDPQVVDRKTITFTIQKPAA